MRFLVLNRAVGSASQDGYAHGKGLVRQQGSIGVAGYRLVVDAVQPGLGLNAARNADK
jgi:hypothetical protein